MSETNMDGSIPLVPVSNVLKADVESESAFVQYTSLDFYVVIYINKVSILEGVIELALVNADKLQQELKQFPAIQLGN